MKQILAILISLLFVLHIRAQQMVSVIDDDTRKPVGVLSSFKVAIPLPILLLKV
jgi:hypothetical protein